MIPQEFFSCYKREGKWYLAAEPSVRCYDFDTYGQHAQLLPLCVGAMIVYVLGIPLLFGGLLYRRRKARQHVVSMHSRMDHAIECTWKDLTVLHCPLCLGEYRSFDTDKAWRRCYARGIWL